MVEILAVLSRKGGVGKTHTSIHIAAILKKRKKDVALLDLDPEGSAASWARQKNALPFPAGGPFPRGGGVTSAATPLREPLIKAELAVKPAARLISAPGLARWRMS